MFTLRAQRGKLSVTRQETLISGSSHVYSVQFKFSKDWQGMAKTVVFRTPDGAISQLLDPSGLCQIPWEVLKKHGVNLMCGVYGQKAGALILPTVWANLGPIEEGSKSTDPDVPPTPSQWDQVLQALTGKGDNVVIDGNDLVLRSGEDELSRVTLPSPGTISSDSISNVVVLTPAEYEALEEPDPNVLYLLGDVPEHTGPIEGSPNAIFSSDVSHIRVMDKEEYEQLADKDTKTLYLIRG